MRPARLIVVIGLGMSLLFVGLGLSAGQSETDVEPGIWLGTAAAGETPAQIAFVVNTDGAVYSGGINFFAVPEAPENLTTLIRAQGCLSLFLTLTAETTPVRGTFTAPDAAVGTFEVSACTVQGHGELTLETPLVGEWQATLAPEDQVADAIHVFANQPAPDTASGRESFMLRCSGCHGVGGVGTDIAPPFIDFLALPYEYVEERVRSGPDFMSAFSEDDLPDDELAQIVEYIQTELVGRGIRDYTEDELAEGRIYYQETCAECHGSRGQGTNDYGPPLLTWPPHSITDIFVGARLPLPGMPRVNVTNEELDLIAGYYILQLSSDE
ncbi:MAG: cytochrome c [Chloroflexi bacterium]|nr:cytochrome c [Chloroflexota bacterium]